MQLPGPRREARPLFLSRGARQVGWIRPDDLELAARLEAPRPRVGPGVPLSPFDPLLWERERVSRLFGLAQSLEIFQPEARRARSCYCMPELAGERAPRPPRRRLNQPSVVCDRHELVLHKAR